MTKTLRLTALIVLTVALLPAVHSVQAYEPSAVLLEFNPKKDTATRTMFQLALSGDQVSPGEKDQISFGEYLIGTVYKDTVLDSLMGLNRHRITFYEYNSRSINLGGGDRVAPQFGGKNAPDLPKEGGSGGGTGGGNGGGNGGGGKGGGGGGGGGGKGGPPGVGGSGNPGGGGFLDQLNLPGDDQGAPMQGPPGGGGGGNGGGGNGGGNGNGGGGGKAGQQRGTALALDTTQINSLDYVENKRGEVLDVTNLDLLRKVSKAHLVNEAKPDSQRDYININVSHVFEWSHLLYVPDYPVYKDDIWFHSFPLHVPGLPDDQPVMTKFIYNVIDFRTVGTRKLAVIDMSGIAEWNMKWEDRNKDELTEFKSWGKMGVTTRYWFDYEHGTIFGMERPPFVDYQYSRPYPDRSIPFRSADGTFQMQFPGQVITMEFFYNTRVTDVSGKPRLVSTPPAEVRRLIDLSINSQAESE